jgi:DNA invertase Pin-like site-specific DNA recombinase
MNNNRPKAYSYIRFSTPDQKKGDSLRRQLELSERYAKAHDLDLDEKLSFRDLGVSAFDSSNLESGGKLGEFLIAVEAGLVATGSYLLVESLDRLSRAGIMDALRLFLSILSKGITIVTLGDDKQYKPNNDDSQQAFTDLVISLAIMSRAHEESATKSKRLKAVWAHKRSQSSSKKLTGQSPAWLKLSSDRSTFVEIPEKVAIVRQIVDLVRSGQGKGAIAKRLNSAGINSIGHDEARQSWYESYISKIVKSRALIGEFQPHRMENRKRVPIGEPIAGYFPRIVSDEEFAVLQDLISARGRRAGGNRGKSFSNLFTGLVRCGYCGSTMVFVDKGIDKRGNRDSTKNRYLVCHKSKRGAGCHHVPWTYAEFEESFFTYARRVDFEQFVTTSNNRISELRRINDQLVLVRSELASYSEQILRLVDAIATSSNPPSAILERIQQLSDQRDDRKLIASELETKREALISRSDMSANAVEALRNVAQGLTERDEDKLFLYRSTLNEYLRRVLDRILLFPGGGIKTHDECNQIKQDMLKDGRWSADEITVFVDSNLDTAPRKHERYFSIQNGPSTIAVVQPSAVAREAWRRIKGFPSLLVNMPNASDENSHIMAGKV